MTAAPDPGAYRPCAGIVLADGRGRVFLGRRADGSGGWQMPQGGIDRGEDAAAAALRELGEETGLSPALARLEAVAAEPALYDLPPGMAPAHWRGRWRGQALTWVLLRFLGRDGDVDLATAHPEFDAWRWASPAEALDAIVPFKRAAYEAAFREFGDRL